MYQLLDPRVTGFANVTNIKENPKEWNVSGHTYCSYAAILRRSQPTSVHQSVSVGHYLLHPNNREFNQGTPPALANHRPGALLLTPDLSTHTMFRPYISTETSASLFFFSFHILPRDSTETKTVFKCESEPWISPKLFLETALLQSITETPLSGRAQRADMSTDMLVLCM